MRKKELTITLSVIIVSVILAVVSWFILPDRVAIQITLSGGAGNTVPKLFGILLPFLISTAFSMSYYKTETKKHLFYAVIGVIIAAAFIIFNRVII